MYRKEEEEIDFISNRWRRKFIENMLKVFENNNLTEKDYAELKKIFK